MKPISKQKFALVITIFFVFDLLINTISWVRPSPQFILIGFYILYLISVIILVFKNKVSSWYMSAFYFGYKSISLLILISTLVIEGLSSRSDGWIGPVTTIEFIVPLFLYSAAFAFCLKTSSRSLYEIKL